MSDDVPASNFSNSPTLILGATAAGVIMGTAAYMSPEQAKGKTAVVTNSAASRNEIGL